MTRKTAREIVLNAIFSFSFDKTADEVLENIMDPDIYKSLSSESAIYEHAIDPVQGGYITRLVRGIYEHLPELDSYIQKYSVGWGFDRISKISTAIMRLSMYEILYVEDVPTASSINEAVEFAKCYDSPEAASFINGLLGSFSRKEISF